MPRKPLPRIDPDNRPYFDSAARRQFVIQRCLECGHWVFYPRVACPYCLSAALEWRKASGRGELLSYALVQRPHHPAFYDEVPIVFAAIRLAEGPVMLSEIRSAAVESLRLGMPLRVAFTEITDEVTIPVWEPQ
jgi:uncharacterized OB-fold protein